MDSTGNNEWGRNGPDAAARETSDTRDPFAALEDDGSDRTDAEERRPGRSRKRLIGAAIFFLVLIASGTGLWMMLGGGDKKVDLRVRDSASKTEQATRDPESVTAQAIAEVRGATAAPTPSPSASPAIGTTEKDGGTSTVIAQNKPVTITIEAT